MWTNKGNKRNATIQVRPMTKREADISTVLLATQRTPPFAPLHILTTSSHIVNAFTREITKWEANGWYGLENAKTIQAVIANLRQ